MIALAGPNGAGKSTFFHSHLSAAGLRFVDADVVARELGIDAYAAAALADALRRELVTQHESFVFETVFSDPVAEKLTFLKEVASSGCTVVLLFVGVSGPEICEERVAMRVAQGGHAVPAEKVAARYPRTLANLALAIRELPHVLVFDNDDLTSPYRRVLVIENGEITFRADPVPAWVGRLLP